MKLDRLLLPVVIVLAVLVVSYPVTSAELKDVFVANPVQTRPVPKELISLGTTGAFGQCTQGKAFRQKLPDGTLDPNNPFTVPMGKVLVITSVQWHTSTSSPNTVVLMKLYRQATENGSPDPLLFSDVANTSGMSDGSGHAGGDISLPTGLVLKSGLRLCATTTPNGDIGLAAYAQGFLTDDL